MKVTTVYGYLTVEYYEGEINRRHIKQAFTELVERNNHPPEPTTKGLTTQVIDCLPWETDRVYVSHDEDGKLKVKAR